MGRWERAGGWGFQQYWGILFLAIGGLFAGGTMIAAATAPPGDRPGLAIIVPALFFCVWLTGAWRISYAGVLTSDEGVRIRTVFRTVTYPWSRIASAQPLGNVLWLSLVGGEQVETPVRRRTSRWPVPTRGGEISLHPDVFDTLVEQLRRRAAPLR